MKFIHYQIMQEVNNGTEDNPQIHKSIRPVSLGPISERSFDAIYAMAVAEAYGEVTVEDRG